MFQFGTKLRSLFTRGEATRTLTPPVAVQPHPISLNPSKKEQMIRNRARVARLRRAIAASPEGEYRSNLQAELERRLAAMKAAGIKDEEV